jgi:four helix bundle protein
MGAKILEELNAYRAARTLKLEVYRLVRAHPDANSDYRFRSQLFEAAASNEVNIAEGFRRFLPGEFAHFLGFALGSREETVRRIQDGIDRGYFRPDACAAAFELAAEAGRLTTALQAYLRKRAQANRVRPPRHPTRPRNKRTEPGTQR